MLIFTTRDTQLMFNQEIRRELNHQVVYDTHDGLRHLLNEYVFGSLLLWDLPAGYMRVLQLSWCPNNIDEHGNPTEFGWCEWFVPTDEHKLPETPDYPHPYLTPVTADHEVPGLAWKRGMLGALINHGAREGKSDWSSHT